MKHQYCAEYQGIAIRPVCEDDLESLRMWRNNKELSRFLSPISEITPDMQYVWYKNYLIDKNLIFFTVIDTEKKKAIGSVALYNFKDSYCEVGKIVIGDASERGKGAGYYSLLMAMCIGIKELFIEDFFLKVCEKNNVACRMYEKIGFKEIGRHAFIGGGEELIMTISKRDFEQCNQIYSDIHIFYSGKL